MNFDAKACRRCKTCARVCPASSLSFGATGLSFDALSCVACGQCVACCPQGALSWDGRAPGRIDRAAYPHPDQVESLLAGRSPVWDFGPEAIDPAVLDRLVRAVREVPAETAGLDIVVITDPEVRGSLDRICLDRFERLYVRRYSRPWVFSLWKKIDPAVDDLARKRTRQALKKGGAFHGAPALIFVLGHPRRRQNRTGAQIALAFMAVVAEAHGLGTVFLETARSILNSSRRARRIISLPRKRDILGILLVGFPETEPLRAGGRPLPGRWIGGRPPASSGRDILLGDTAPAILCRRNGLMVMKLRMLLWITMSLIALGALLILVAVYASSSRHPEPFLDKDGKPLAGSISEKVFLEINGVKQGMFIKGRSLSNPVLLYLHGGMPDFFLTRGHPTGLEDHFTVVWWEQRGAGISYAGDIDPKTLNSRQLIEDTKTLSRYLCQRFGREKIYLMGHSGGSFIGLQAAAEAPELYRAYIGVAQMADQRASEKEAYDYMLRLFEKAGDRGMSRRLRRAPVLRQGGIPRAYLAVRDKAMHRLGVGTMHEMRSVFRGLFIPSLFFKEYSFSDKIKLWKAKAKAGLSVISNEILATDLSRRVTRLKVPFYVFHGSMDYTVSYALSKAYFERMEAPVKGFYTFTHSAHCPLFEEPQKMIRILVRDVLKNDHILSDP